MSELWFPETINGTAGGSAVMTRPADVTAYAAGDEISNSTTAGSVTPWVFTNVAAQNGGYARLTGIDLLTSNPLWSAQLIVLLFTAAPTAAGDNAAYDYSVTDYGNFVLGQRVYAGYNNASATNSLMTANGLDENYVFPTQRNFRCASDSRNLYGVLIATGALTPVSGQTFRVRLRIERTQ